MNNIQQQHPQPEMQPRVCVGFLRVLQFLPPSLTEVLAQNLESVPGRCAVAARCSSGTGSMQRTHFTVHCVHVTTSVRLEQPADKQTHCLHSEVNTEHTDAE